MKNYLVLLLLLVAAIAAVEGAEQSATRRFGIFVGANNGGRERTALRYAQSDARSLSRVFADMGGIRADDNILLVEPSVQQINRMLKTVSEEVVRSKQTHKRTEIVFYYSGHANEDGLLLGRERYEYRALRETINNIPADMRIVILDSCSSGMFTRAKGGVKTQAFMLDDSAAAAGHAFLTSSSDTETSQESDAIRSSYFTHSLLAGLRGAADMVGDGRVTLNEVYRFAYDETLSKTENSIYGRQHPSFDIQISGSGDVVLTDVHDTAAGLILDGTVAGRVSIRDGENFLIAELTKVQGKPIELGLEKGRYNLTLRQGDAVFRAEVTLEDGKHITVSGADFKQVAASAAVARGDAAEWETDAETPAEEPVRVQFYPGYSLVGSNNAKTTNSVLIGIFGAIGHNLEGFGFSLIGLNNTGFMNGYQGSWIYNTVAEDIIGFQGSGVFNWIGGSLTGAQIAGIANWSGAIKEGAQGAGILSGTLGDLTHGVEISGITNLVVGTVREGAQIAGIINWVGKDIDSGAQIAGIENWAGKNIDNGAQIAGIVNWAGGNVAGAQIAGFVNWTGGGVDGAQIAGISNWAGGRVEGAQAGLFNYRRSGGGLQLGLVNIAGSNEVTSVGLVNIVRGGMFHPTVYIDGLGFFNGGLKSGAKNFYSLITMGGSHLLGSGVSDPAGLPYELFVVRSGLGYEWQFNKFFTAFDVSAGHIMAFKDKDGEDFKKADGWDAIKDAVDEYDFHTVFFVLQARLSVGYRLFKHLGISGGLSYDFMIKKRGESLPAPQSIPGLSSARDERFIHSLGFFIGLEF